MRRAIVARGIPTNTDKKVASTPTRLSLARRRLVRVALPA